jgi:hypothetical protein
MMADINDRRWVGSRHGSDRAADGGFASLLKNSCRSAVDPIADVRDRYCSRVNGKVT